MKLIKIFLILGFVLNAELAMAATPTEEVQVSKSQQSLTNLSAAATKAKGDVAAAISTPQVKTVMGPPVASVESCVTAATRARTFCLTSLNPKIQTVVGALGVLMGTVQMMKSMSDSCSKFNDGMKMAQIALTAYNGMCTAAQASCSSSCGAVKTSFDSTRSQLPISIAKVLAPQMPMAEADVTFAQGILADLDIAVTGQLEVCESYKMNIAAAGVGVMGILQQSGLMGKCEKETTVADCTKDPTNAQCPQSVDCTNPTNAQNAICICKSNPTAAGCGSTTANSSGAPSAGTPTNVTGAGALDPGSFGGGGSDNFISPSGAAPAGGSSLGGGASGGGGGGSGGGGTGGAKEKEGLKKSGLNANILGGYEGGGGGGGSRGGSANSGLKDYLPGGAKDPNRNIAAQGAGSGEVTAAGSKSNWEKVTDRYQDNKRTLMGP